MNDHPEILIIAGPNGAGKSTSARAIVRDKLHIGEFVNADVIAQGLAAFDVNSVALEAGRIMLNRLRDLANQRKSFAFETTLAARSYASWIEDLRSTGYQFHLIYLWLAAPEIAVQRVADRVRMGGHDIPEVVIRRRYQLGLKNFFKLYQPISDSWQVLDNSDLQQQHVIAAGCGSEVRRIGKTETWNRIVEDYGND